MTIPARTPLLVLGALGLALLAWQLGPGRSRPTEALEGPGSTAEADPAVAELDAARSGGRRELPVDPAPATGPGAPLTDEEPEPAARVVAPRGATTPAERRAAIERQLRLHAGRAATRLGLASGAEERILEVWLEANDRADAILTEHARLERTADSRRAMREALDEIPRWQHQRFVELFGEVAAQGILEHDDTAAAREEGIPLLEGDD